MCVRVLVSNDVLFFYLDYNDTPVTGLKISLT